MDFNLSEAGLQFQDIQQGDKESSQVR